MATSTSPVAISLRSREAGSDEGGESTTPVVVRIVPLTLPRARSPGGPARSRALIVPLEQSLAIQGWIAEGVDRAADELAESHAFDTELTVLQTRCCALGDFGAQEIDGGADWIAGVLRAFRGRVCGTAILSMDPEDALAWSLADGGDGPPVEAYLDVAGRVLEAIALTAAEAIGVEVELGAARLEEDTVGGCLLRTHAPSDTVVVSSRIEVRAGGQTLPAQLLLVMEPKVVSALLGALAVSLH